MIFSGTTYLYGSFDDVAALWATVPGSSELSEIHGQAQRSFPLTDLDDERELTHPTPLFLAGPAFKGYHTFPCDATPKMSLRFGGKDFTIAVDALSLGKVSPGSSDCVGSIVGWSSSLKTTWLGEHRSVWPMRSTRHDSSDHSHVLSVKSATSS
jgi:hypothetical protein